ncbi:MAG: hypothetical protein L0G99_14785 [Propionibacteriales bacterium]|nr:hypothetical protein [Propionibacteriales bacterium]
MRERRGDRGMVTAELAMGTIAVVVLVILLSGAASLLVVQMGCLDSASEIARQTARGDKAAVAMARSDVPAGSAVSVRRTNDAVRVEVSTPVRLLPSLPAFTVRAEATTVLEPGE